MEKMEKVFANYLSTYGCERWTGVKTSLGGGTLT